MVTHKPEDGDGGSLKSKLPRIFLKGLTHISTPFKLSNYPEIKQCYD
jgi:hypothetical protein